MPSLDPNSWSQRDHDALDRHITGNWEGEPYMGDPMNVEPEPAMRKVYIAANDTDGSLYLYDAYTWEQLSDRWEDNRHNLIDLAIANDWDVVDGPQTAEEEEDDDEMVDDYPGFDPMFLM